MKDKINVTDHEIKCIDYIEVLQAHNHQINAFRDFKKWLFCNSAIN